MSFPTLAAEPEQPAIARACGQAALSSASMALMASDSGRHRFSALR